MTDLDDALISLTSWLDRQQIPYMVIGGYAVTVWGEPRFTRDLDVTISVPAERLNAVVGSLCSNFIALVSDALKFVGDTRVLPITIGAVPANIVFAALPYEETAIARSRKIMLTGGSVNICSPEDLILHKVVSHRARDREDIEGVFRYRHSELDYSYLDPRVEELSQALSDNNLLNWYTSIRNRWK
jgi:uncharacterized nucleotidyltransferase DUF6036